MTLVKTTEMTISVNNTAQTVYFLHQPLEGIGSEGRLSFDIRHNYEARTYEYPGVDSYEYSNFQILDIEYFDEDGYLVDDTDPDFPSDYVDDLIDAVQSKMF